MFVPVQKDPVDSGNAECASVVKPKSNSTGMKSKQRGKISEYPGKIIDLS
jgi:hypothetical protein